MLFNISLLEQHDMLAVECGINTLLFLFMLTSLFVEAVDAISGLYTLNKCDKLSLYIGTGAPVVALAVAIVFKIFFSYLKIFSKFF